MPEPDKEELLWAASTTGERFPVQVDTNHPMWKAFLESGSLSPSQFFRAFLAPNSYFHSPTPWGSHRRLAAKVSELLDSFRPGSYSYRPFKKASQSSREGTTWSRRHRTVPNPPQNQPRVSPDPLILDRPDPEAPIIPQSPFNTRFQDLDGVRRRLYVDLGRPRPFYRRRPSNNSLGKGLDLIASNSATPASLEDLVKMSLVQCLGLARLKEILIGQKSPLMLPKLVKERMLTFLCDDFEEIVESDFGVSGPDLRTHPASYKVKCVHDGRDYLAIFATSEVDKHMSNLWSEYGVWMGPHCPDVVPILGLAADPLTENVFFILEDLPQSLKDYHGSAVAAYMEELREEFQHHGLPLDLLKKESVFVNPQTSRIIFQNPVLFSRFRYRFSSNTELDLPKYFKMKTLLVFTAALVGTLAQDMVAEKEMMAEEMITPKEMEVSPIPSLALPYANWPLAYNTLPWAYNGLPYAYNSLPYAYNSLPYAYNTLPIQPVETKLIPEEFDVEVKTYELEKVETGCKNIFGLDVPCAQKEKRSADEDMTVVEVAPEAETAEVMAEAEEKPVVYAANTLPLTYNTLPLGYNTLPLAYSHAPLAYNTLPLAYNTLPLAYKTLDPKVQEYKVPTPVFKTVVEKIPVEPACQNEWGLLVPCA